MPPISRSYANIRIATALTISVLLVMTLFPGPSQNFFGILPKSSATNPWCNANPELQACQFQSEFLQRHENVTSIISPPLGALPPPPTASKKEQVRPNVITYISGQPYVAALAYKNSGAFVYISGWQTTMQLYDYAYPSQGGKSLGSNTVSGGLNVHVKAAKDDVDFLFQFYAYYDSAGYANVAWAVYSACAGLGFACGPAYGNCNKADCPIAYQTISSGSLSGIDTGEAPISLKMYWNGGDNAYVFDYQDTNQNPYWWTVLYLQPSGTYSNMAPNGMALGEDVDASTQLLNAGCGCAYFSQVGFTMSGIPSNSNWELLAGNTVYGLLNQPSYANYLDHAYTLPIFAGCGQYCYSFWKEIWQVSQIPAQIGGIYLGGSGYNGANDIYIFYSGGFQQGGVQLW